MDCVYLTYHGSLKVDLIGSAGLGLKRTAFSTMGTLRRFHSRIYLKPGGIKINCSHSTAVNWLI